MFLKEGQEVFQAAMSLSPKQCLHCVVMCLELHNKLLYKTKTSIYLLLLKYNLQAH